MNTREEYSFGKYTGVCPLCKKEKRAIIETGIGDERGGIILPAGILTSCACRFPVVEVQLIGQYYGTSSYPKIPKFSKKRGRPRNKK